MDDDEEAPLLCPICSVPICTAGTVGDSGRRWQERAVLLSDPSWEFERREFHYRAGKRPRAPRHEDDGTDRFDSVEIRRERIDLLHDRTCRVLDGEDAGAELVTNLCAGRTPDGVDDPRQYTLAVHEACLDIAARVMRTSLSDTPVRSFRTLWKVLRTRFDAKDNEYMTTIMSGDVRRRILIAHEFYLPSYFVDDDAMWHGTDHSWYCADPIDIPLLTPKILDKVKLQERGSSGGTSAREFDSRFMALPPELRARVIDHMAPFQDFPVEGSGLLPSEAWLGLLLSKRYLPFLWDLDDEAVKWFCDQLEAGDQEADWERLFRQLTSPIHHRAVTVETEENGGFRVAPMVRDFPPGFLNRRRIWALVEEMFVGDVLPTARWGTLPEHIPSMPRYWDAAGDPVYPVVRVDGLVDDDDDI